MKYIPEKMSIEVQQAIHGNLRYTLLFHLDFTKKKEKTTNTCDKKNSLFSLQELRFYRLAFIIGLCDSLGSDAPPTQLLKTIRDS